MAVERGRFLEAEALPELVAILHAGGRQVVAPVIRQAAMVYRPIGSAREIPRGWGDRQAAGSYRLHHRDDQAWFGQTSGPVPWKRYLFPPWDPLVDRSHADGGLRAVPVAHEVTPQAFLGVRPCDLVALGILDRTFLHCATPDPRYRVRRESTFVVAVQCTEPGGTCFCASMGTGPDARAGFDIVLTELDGGLVAQAGSVAGRQVLESLPTREATAGEEATARDRVRDAAHRMGRTLDYYPDLPSRLMGAWYSDHWNRVAERCTACGNCTQVCPTCFCNTVWDRADLRVEQGHAVRQWDSCFNIAFAATHYHNYRHSRAARYRQWCTHKLATWWDQYGTLGCVGCGRCITWCPEGIDITAEAKGAVATLEGG